MTDQWPDALEVSRGRNIAREPVYSVESPAPVEEDRGVETRTYVERQRVEAQYKEEVQRLNDQVGDLAASLTRAAQVEHQRLRKALLSKETVKIVKAELRNITASSKSGKPASAESLVLLILLGGVDAALVALDTLEDSDA